MNALFTVLAILVILAAILMTIVVLLQNGKGGGLASNFVAGNQAFGVRQTADLLEKITWGLAAVILVLAVVTNFTYNAGQKDKNDYSEQIEQTASFPAPAGDAAPVADQAADSAADQNNQ